MMSGDGQSGGYYMRDRNRVSGPFDVETLKRFVRTQRLARHHQLSADRMTWARAAELLPEVFATHVTVPPTGATETVLLSPEDELPQMDQPEYAAAPAVATDPRPTELPWGLIAALAATVGGGAAMAVLVWLVLALADSRWSARDVQNEIAPMLTVIRGVDAKGGKATCYGVVVSRHHVVVPAIAATYRSPKAESEELKGDREWHSAHLVLIDPVSKLAVLRADLGHSVNLIQVQDGNSLPRVRDDVYVVAPDRRGLDVVCRAELDEVFHRGEPDQMLILSFNDEMPVLDELLGRAVVDEEGRFAGLVVGVTPDGRAMCAAGNEVRIKRNEAKKLPADHVLEPIGDDEPNTEPSRSEEEPEDKQSSTGQKPSPAKQGESADKETTPTESEPASGQPDSSEVHDDDQNIDGPRGRRSTTSDEEPHLLSGKGVVGALGEAGANVVSGMTDVVAPQLSEDTAATLGRDHLENVLSRHPRCGNKAVVLRVQRLCEEMVQAAGEDRARYSLTVVEDPTINAYAFVGRNLVVTTGFMDFAGRDDDMIRFVLAHEIGHIVLGHADEPYRRLIAVNGLGAGGEVAAGVAQTIFKNSPMNQAQEKAADCFAVSCMRRAGRPIDGGIRFFERIVEEEDSSADGDVVGALFSSHPDTRLRIDHLQKRCGQADE